MAYESALTIRFGAQPARAEERWDHRWQLGAAAPPEVPAEVVAAASSVGRDLVASRAIGDRFHEATWAFRTGDRDVAVPGRIRFGSLPTEQGAAELTAFVADRVYEHLTGYEFTQWPICPGHQHPLVSSIVADTAAWTCPATGEPVFRIGELES